MTASYIGSGADGDELVRRAMAAYWRSAGRQGEEWPIPGQDSYRCELDGKAYVVLRNVDGVLAVYRVRNDGFLKELRRWPTELAGPEAVAS